MGEPLYIMIGVDCDHDRGRFNQKASDSQVAWQGLHSLSQKLLPIREQVQKEIGEYPTFTLNLRADRHVFETMGSFDYCFQLFYNELEDQFDSSDEVAWHHHHLRFKDDVWTQELHDEGWMREHIFEAYESIRDFAPKVLHTGWCFMNTISMNAFNDVGIQVDYSALPRMSVSEGVTGLYDYSKVGGATPFIPDRGNYQSGGGSKDNSILEIPTCTASSIFLRGLTGAANFINGRASGSADAKNSFVQINSNPLVFRPFVNSFFKQNPEAEYFGSYFHCDEVLECGRRSKKDRILYQNRFLYDNLKFINAIANENGRSIKFVSFSEYGDRVKGSL